MKPTKQLKKLLIYLLLLSSIGFADQLKNDIDIVSEAMDEALVMQAKYEAKEEMRSSQITWLKFQNSVLIICLAATAL